MKIEITRVEQAFEGASFGAVGAYEKIVGHATGDVDPAHPLNACIVNIDKAPTNARGRVEYECDFYLLKPADMRRGNRRIFYDVLNRGLKPCLHTINEAPRDINNPMMIARNDPSLAAHAGNGFLMRQGYTILWSGWQDGTGAEDSMWASFPIATNDGEPIVEPSLDEFVFENLQSPVVATLSYPANAMDQASCVLTVRQRSQDPRIVISPTNWRFLSATQIEISRPAGFDASAIYEFIYPARDPKVMGLGFAAARDMVSFMRNESADAADAPNPLNIDGEPGIDYVLAYGLSQSGRFLRDFLYEGFNQDYDGGKVFDGVMASMAGSRKSFINYSFAQPGRNVRQHEDRVFPHDQFPFSYATTTDPISGATDGILARCEASNTCPKIMQTESSTDFFHGRGSLLVTDGNGEEIPIAENVRIYYFAGVQHGGGGDPAVDYALFAPASKYRPNPADFPSMHRALLDALDQWVCEDAPPPPSQFPNLRDGSLVSASADSYEFPDIPNVTYPGVISELSQMDFNVMPPQPVPGRNYVVMASAIDADGNETAGVLVPDIAVPLGTHTGWNARRAGYAEGGICALGAYFPFAKTRKERLSSGDPRLSIEERYKNEDDYIRKVADAVRRLCEQWLLLPEDVDPLIEDARRKYRRAMGYSEPT